MILKSFASQTFAAPYRLQARFVCSPKSVVTTDSGSRESNLKNDVLEEHLEKVLEEFEKQFLEPGSFLEEFTKKTLEK